MSNNPNRISKRFLRNKLAVLSLIVIICICLVAIFASIISPDATPNANTMHLELAVKDPGFSVQCVKKQKLEDNTKEKKSVLENFFIGKEDAFEYIPIHKYEAVPNAPDSIILHTYFDEKTSVPQRFSLQQLSSNYTSFTIFVQKGIVTKKYILGTDRFGRDLLSRLIQGTRVSMAVGIIAVLLSISIGVFLGSIAGYYGGKVDAFVQWILNVVWAIPTLLLVFAITIVLGKGFWQIFIAVGLTMWVGTARLIRGQVMSLKQLDYIQAAKTMGFSNLRIIVKHILPNIIGPTIVMAASNFATAILIEAGLSFLGVGVQPPTPSWGLMIKENYNFIITNKLMLAFIPGFAIMLLVLCFNLLGNGLRDAFDVRD
jgi:ABC-type dipeptide/oligopeptide/nickel transport system permease subunit